jgi:hypothetical protein
VFNLNLRMRDLHNPNFPAVNSLIQFVRFGGTEKVRKGLQSQYKGDKYQESIFVNSDYHILSKVFSMFKLSR